MLWPLKCKGQQPGKMFARLGGGENEKQGSQSDQGKREREVLNDYDKPGTGFSSGIEPKGVDERGEREEPRKSKQGIENDAVQLILKRKWRTAIEHARSKKKKTTKKKNL